MSAATSTGSRTADRVDVPGPTGAPPTPADVRRRRRGARLVDVVVLDGALCLAMLPLVPVYGVAAVVPPVAGGLVVGTAVALVAAARAWGAAVTTALVLLGYLLVGPTLAVPTASGGRLPSGDSVALLLTGAVTVWKQVLTLDPTLGTTGNLLVAPLLLALVGSAVAVSGAARSRRGGPHGPRAAWSALVPVLVLGVSVVLATQETVAPVAAGVVLALLLLGWAAWRVGTLAPRRPVALLLVVAALVGGGAAGGAWLGEQRPRLVLRDELVPPFDPRDQPSPLASFRRFVKEWGDDELLTVTGLPAGTPVRLATMDAFDGVVWDVAGAEAADGSGSYRRVGDTITSVPAGRTVEVAFEVERLPSVWLPTVGYARRFDFSGGLAGELAADLRYNDATGSAVLTSGVVPGARWTAEVVVPEVPDDEEIGDAPVADVRLPAAERVPDAVPVFAGDLAGTAATPVLVARSLEQGLAERGWFSHGLEGEAPSLSGHGAARLTTLLTGDLMVGDGEQYASAMALMAREMGLPSRVVMGFVPDEEDAADGSVTITGDDVEAWVEIAFVGHGWVPFHPTPDESKTPSDDVPQDESRPQPQVVQPPPPPVDPVRPPDDDTEQPRTEETDDDAREEDGLRRALLVAAAVSAPVALLLAPFVLVALAKRGRRRRRRRAGAPVDRVVGGWEEMLDHARDLRRAVPASATRREAAVHLAGAFAGARRGAAVADRRGALGGRVARLASRADAMVFGPGDPSDADVAAYWTQVDETVRAMQRAVPWRQRVRA
ncbi:transglutaminase-like domain-containing protein, partial [Actinotalea sp. AC32]|nr:transglutaminase-like domain-containing protein [Actinotalea sp. AC32]